MVPGHEVTAEARREPAIGAAPVLKEEDRPQIRVQAVAENNISFDGGAPRRHLLGDLIGDRLKDYLVVHGKEGKRAEKLRSLRHIEPNGTRRFPCALQLLMQQSKIRLPTRFVGMVQVPEHPLVLHIRRRGYARPGEIEIPDGNQ